MVMMPRKVQLHITSVVGALYVLVFSIWIWWNGCTTARCDRELIVLL